MALLDTNDDHLFASRLPGMTLLSGPLCILSHACRVVLLEKDVDCNIEYIAPDEHSERLGEANPRYYETPALIDRDITLYESQVVVGYLDERFPHPPLLPVDPVGRAKIRLIVARLTRDCLRPVFELGETLKPKVPAALKKNLYGDLLGLAKVVAEQPFLMSEHYTLADAHLAPLLWRLPALGITLPRAASALERYAERIFDRDAFQGSLSPNELDFRPL